MEFEVARHDWLSLQGAAGDARSAASALRELAVSRNREEALSAASRIHGVVFANGLLCEAAPAVASGLVHALWHRSYFAEDLILEILSDLSVAVVDRDDPTVYGPVSAGQCMFEICLGFPAYVEILESSNSIDSRTACIDLVMMCGMSNRKLTQRAIYVLVGASEIPELAEHREAISASIRELRAIGLGG